MNSKAANFVYIAVALITVALIRWSVPVQEDKPHGIVLPIDSHKRIPGLPIYYKPLAMIHVQYHYKSPGEQNFATARNYAKELAGSTGAKDIAEQQSFEDPVGKMILVNAIAIQ